MVSDSNFSNKLRINYINLLGSTKYVNDEKYIDELMRNYDLSMPYISGVLDGKVDGVNADDLLRIREAISKRKDAALNNQIQL